MDRVKERVCPPEGGSLRVVYLSDFQSNPSVITTRFENIRLALSGVGYSGSEAVQWPVPAHMPHSEVETIFLPAGPGPIVVVKHELGTGNVRHVALFWAAAT